MRAVRRSISMLRTFLTGSASRRSRQEGQVHRFATPMLMLILAASAAWRDAQAVAPYRSPEDYGPSVEARHHLPACRRAALDSMAGAGRIESETFVQRADAEYFRFVLRNGSKEILIICDGHAGVIRRQIDIWGNL